MYVSISFNLETQHAVVTIFTMLFVLMRNSVIVQAEAEKVKKMAPPY